MTERLLTFPELKTSKGVPFTRQYLNELIRKHIFPAPVKTPGGGHLNLWVESEVDRYIEALKLTRDSAPPDEAKARRVAAMMAGREAAKKKREAAGTVTIARRKRRQRVAQAAADPR